MVNGSRRARIDRRARGISLFGIANVIFLSLLCLITLYPLYYILIHSFNEGVDSLNGGLYLWVRKFTLFNYQYVLGNNVIMNSYKITISRTLLGTVLGLFVTGITAYGMSFRSMPGRKALMGLIIVSMLFSGGLIPYYIQLSKLHLADTFWVYIFPAMFNIWNMFVLMKSFMALPDSLHESAFIDGAGEITILAKIVLPLSKPTLAAIALFIAVSHWNDWYSGAFFVSTAKLIPVQTYLQRLFSADSLSSLAAGNVTGEAAFRESQTMSMTITSIKMAAVIIGTLPILCVYPFIQKHFTKGALTGSVKG